MLMPCFIGIRQRESGQKRLSLKWMNEKRRRVDIWCRKDFYRIWWAKKREGNTQLNFRNKVQFYVGHSSKRENYGIFKYQSSNIESLCVSNCFGSKMWPELTDAVSVNVYVCTFVCIIFIFYLKWLNILFHKC